MTKLSIYIIIFINIAFISAQGFSKRKIIKSHQYYYGTGISFDRSEARDKALSELISQIAVTVESSFINKIEEKNFVVTDEVQSILESHSVATLKNVEMSSKSVSGGRIEVFCYIKIDQVEKIYEERRKLIANIVTTAEIYEAENNCAFALKLYYFSIVLMNSLPDENIKYNDINYSILIPNRINDIINSIKFEFVKDEVISEKERQITLRILKDQQSVSLLDFTFWDGTNQVSALARDGYATFKLVGASVQFSELKTSVKYAYYECRNEYRVVSQLWNIVQKPTFLNTITIDLTQQQSHPLKKKKTPPLKIVDQIFDIKLNYQGEDIPAETIVNRTNKFLKLIEENNFSKIKSQYAEDPFLEAKVTDYMRFNKPQPLDRQIEADLNPTQNGWELRRVRMMHDYPSIHKQTTEYLVLDFSKLGELVDINLSISEFLYDKFVESGEFGNDWDNRQEIIKFVEKFRTAYQTRDITKIDQMFSEDAIIIKGRVFETKGLPPDLIDSSYNRMNNQPAWEEIRLTKNQFLKNEQNIFNNQKDLLIEFSTFDIIQKNNVQNVYGVEMRQSYMVSTYQDEGYLFLLIDFNDVDPLIYVRAWQPNTWDEDMLIKTGNFRIYE